MAKTGTVRIFNCTPHPVYLTINGQVIRDELPGLQDDGSPSQFSDQGGSYQYPFARLSAPSVDGVAQFAQSNSVEVSGSYVHDVAYDVEIDPTEIEIFANLNLYIFNDSAALVTVEDGKVQTGSLLTPS